MYETLEHWNQYKQEKDLQTNIAKEYELEICNEKTSYEEMDKFLAELIKKNGTTNY